MRVDGTGRGRRRLLGDLPAEVGVLTVIAFAVAIGFGIVAPVIPLYAREFGVGTTAAGAVVSTFALMRLLSGFSGGSLVDRLGERTVLALGLGIVSVSSLLAGLAQSYWQLLVLRGSGGVGSAMFTVSAMSLLLRVVSAEQRGRASGWYQGGFLLGGVMGPAFGGALAAISLRAPFFLYAATLAVATAVAVFALAHTHLADRAAGAVAPPALRLADAMRLRAYQAVLVTNLGVGWVLFGIRSSLIPLFVADALGRGPGWVSAGFVVGSAAQALALWPAGRSVDRIGRRPAMLGGGLLALLAVGLLAVLESLGGFMLSMAMYGVAAAFLGVAPAAVIGDVMHGARGGKVVAAGQMSADLGAVVGPLIAGALVDADGYPAAFLFSAAVMAGGVVMAARMPETRRPAGT